MQVTLAVAPILPLGVNWGVFAKVSRGFSIFSIISGALISLGLLHTFSLMLLREAVFCVEEFSSNEAKSYSTN